VEQSKFALEGPIIVQQFIQLIILPFHPSLEPMIDLAKPTGLYVAIQKLLLPAVSVLML